MVTHKINHNDKFWVSKDMVDKYSPLILGEYYCFNEHGKLDFYDDQIIKNDQLFILTDIIFTNNIKRKWYQFWEPKRILDGYTFQCIDLKEMYKE